MNTIYKVGFIYKISTTNNSLVYYGSTCNFTKRMKAHQKEFCAYLKGSLNYKLSSFEILSTNNYYCCVIETHFNISRHDLETIEGNYIRNNKCVNSRQPKSSSEERKKQKEDYRKQNSERRKQASANYYLMNKSKILKKNHCYICDMDYAASQHNRHLNSKKHSSLESKVNDYKKLFRNVLNQIDVSPL